VTAVGGVTAGGQSVPLIEQGNGKTWRITRG
jgi:hypothetical protein